MQRMPAAPDAWPLPRDVFALFALFQRSQYSTVESLIGKATLITFIKGDDRHTAKTISSNMNIYGVLRDTASSAAFGLLNTSLVCMKFSLVFTTETIGDFNIT